MCRLVPSLMMRKALERSVRWAICFVRKLKVTLLCLADGSSRLKAVASMVFNTDRGCSKAKSWRCLHISWLLLQQCCSAFPEFEFVLDCSTYHVVPNDQVCWSAGGYSKSVGKAGNDGSVNDVQCLAWIGI